MEGYIKDWRKELESDIWLMPPLYHRIWQWLKYTANHKDEYIPMRDGSKMLVKRGQKLTSVRKIAEGVGWYERGVFKKPNPKTVQDVLDWLVKNEMITIETGNRKYTIITIVNYGIYQAKDDDKSNSLYTDDIQLLDINKNDKNGKKYIEGTSTDIGTSTNIDTTSIKESSNKRTNTITSAKSARPTLADPEKLLSRYTPEQQEIIAKYWDTIRFTRKNAKIADSIKIREMEYWARFPVDIVIEAIKIHLSRYQTKPEEYTRGIMRRLAREREMCPVSIKASPENNDNSVYDNLF